jgi:hypothetical protein
LAQRFLWVVAGLTVLVIVGALVLRIWGAELLRFTSVPTVPFEEVAAPEGLTYADAELWIARPDIRNNPAAWSPAGVERSVEPEALLFFVHPTSYLERSSWNAPIDHEDSQNRARLFVRSQASAFNHVAQVWAPKYRQATFGAFLTSREDARKALDFAYRDVLTAYEAFLEQAPADRPIILAAHSQGSLHLLRLLEQRIAGSPELGRIAAAYVVGWPVSTTADLPSLGLPGCETADQPACILAWQSFGEPADPRMVTDVYDASQGPTGVSRAGSPMLCVNPLTGGRGNEASRDDNLGTLYPNGDFSDAELRPGAVPARCDVRGLLLIGENPPDLGPYVLFGNNYHVYDYALFWGNVRADAARRLAAFTGR